MHPCPFCENNTNLEYIQGPSLIKHMKETHGFILPSRQRSIHRPPSSEYHYVSDVRQHWDEKQYGCPSCWYHACDLTNVNEHIKTAHSMARVVITQHSNGSSNEIPFTYEGTHYDKTLVNDILSTIDSITLKFKDLLKL